MAKIRVFDPACGSGNFLVIAYKEMRAIEAVINERRDEEERRSDIPLTNFRGIELRDFPAEIARLALIIAEYQCDVTYRGQQEALAAMLPLDAKNWITCGNALRLDWLSICPPTGTGVRLVGDDLFNTPLDQAQIDFENEGGETYICGNPPYLGSSLQTADQKQDMRNIFEGQTSLWKSLDYVAGWFKKAADYGCQTLSAAAFVSTNSLCQGQQVPILWSLIFKDGHHISFAYTSFKWANLASHNAGVIVIVVGITRQRVSSCRLYANSGTTEATLTEVANINGYLVASDDIEIMKRSSPISGIAIMDRGNSPVDGGNLLLSREEAQKILDYSSDSQNYIRRIYGSAELIRGLQRYCLWIEDEEAANCRENPLIATRLDAVKEMRLASPKAATNKAANFPHKFDEIRQFGKERIVAIPRISSENRDYLPVGIIPTGDIITDLNFGLFNAEIWNAAILMSKLHIVWIATVCGKMKSDFRYSNLMGWNTFPVPTLTDQNKADLTRCAEDILLAREAYFPKTIADLYDPENMPDNLRRAHEANDEVLERIYIGRRFKNDTERLEKLFELYTKMTRRRAA